MTVSSKIDQELDAGLISKHSYGILDIKEIKNQKFIKLNNPL